MPNDLDATSEFFPEPKPAIAAHFEAIAENGRKGPIGELVVLLSTGELENSAFAAHVRRHGVAGEKWFLSQLLDLSLGFIQSGLDGGRMTQEHLADVRKLNAFFRIKDGDFIANRPAEVAAVLSAQLEVILEDSVLSEAEELLQVELQSCFGLGYDEYLTLTRVPFEHAILDLQLRAGGQGAVAQDARRKLAALEPMYRLVTAQRRTLGGLY